MKISCTLFLILIHCQVLLAGSPANSSDSTKQITVDYVENLVFEGDYRRAISIISEFENKQTKETFDLSENRWDNLFLTLGNAYLNLGIADSAMLSYRKGLSISRTLWGKDSLALIQHNIGLVFWEDGEYDSAVFYLERAGQVWESQREEHPRLPAFYMNMSILLGEKGEVKRAFDYNELALQYSLRGFGDIYVRSYIYNRKGVLYHNSGDYANALKFFQAGFENSRQIFDLDHSIYELHYINLSNAYTELDQLDSALFYCRKSMANSKLNFGDPNSELYAVYEGLGGIHDKLGAIDSAIFYYNKAVENITEFRSETHPYVLKVLNKAGLIYLQRSDFDNALAYFDRAVNAYFDGKVSDALETGLVDENGSGLFYALYGKAKTYRAMYFKSYNKEHLQKALNLYALLVQHLKNADYNVRKEDDKIPTDELNALFTEYITLLDTNEGNLGEDERLQIIFSTMESYKASQLKRAISLSSVKAIDSETSKQYNNLRLEHGLLESKKLETSGADQVEEIKQQQLALERQIDLAFTKLQKEQPDFRRDRLSDFDLKKTQASLASDEAIVHYVQISDSVFYALKVEPEVFKFYKLEASLSDSDKGLEPDWLWHTYQSILAPLEISNETKVVTIIPDGLLWNVNFGVLLTEAPKQTGLRTRPFLLKRYAIGYAYSVALNDQSHLNRKSNRKQLLAFSYAENTGNEGTTLSLSNLRSSRGELPGSHEEILAIIDEVSDGDYYYGKDASEKNFKEIASEYQILHLAVHGEADEENPDQSKLDFYHTGDSLQDGYLHAFELENLNLNADLAVLSACETGAGKIERGEGVMSLGRAFASAGVNSLLLTRWEVSDAIAPEIMQVFYRELKKGKRKSEALRLAKLEFLEKANNISADPFYWSSFYILGNDDPVMFERENSGLMWYLTIGLVGLLAGFIVVRRKVRE
ncbi:MAG: CHAT domain-containing tetratricopeptide repeat protein [Bacteroidota bacterium]